MRRPGMPLEAWRRCNSCGRTRLMVGNTKDNPGNANLLIGVVKLRDHANQEIGVPGWSG
ncbi:MAG: hypothetical protein HY650_02930 [Acidobacteria bacterium]|nr:hypothetical protein [Acidobacteriota bacterium]